MRITNYIYSNKKFGEILYFIFLLIKNNKLILV